MTDQQHEGAVVEGDGGRERSGAAKVPCRALPGVEADAVSAFLAALANARATLDGIPRRLEAARVHDEAFGKLIDAHKVRDAYHERLPATERNVDEACAVIDHLTGEFTAAPVSTSASSPLPAPRAALS